MNERLKRYFENPRKIVKVEPCNDYSLILTFDNEEVKKYEMINELYGIFEVLKNINKFKMVFINEVGNIAWNIDDNVDSSIHWENQIDLCKDMLYLESVPLENTSWDPDYTKLTPDERIRLEKAENGEYVNAEDIDWDN